MESFRGSSRWLARDGAVAWLAIDVGCQRSVQAEVTDRGKYSGVRVPRRLVPRASVPGGLSRNHMASYDPALEVSALCYKNLLLVNKATEASRRCKDSISKMEKQLSMRIFVNFYLSHPVCEIRLIPWGVAAN